MTSHGSVLQRLKVMGATFMGGGRARAKRVPRVKTRVWARPGTRVTFRAELMPGRGAADRTFRVARVLPVGRLLVEGLAGEHAMAEFEPGRGGA